VAFFTLIERHILGLTQSRFGPKKIRIYGLIQPFIDGLKLCRKENIQLFNTSNILFYLVIILNFITSYCEFILLPYNYRLLTHSFRYVILIIIIGITVYFVILAGVFSKRKYSYLGGIRSRVSNIRFEIIFSLNILVFILYRNNYQINYLINIGLYLFFLVFILNILVETFRAPFDYAESERELVRGFNTEYSSVSFVLIFLKEYRSIIFFCVFTSVIFFNGRI